MDVGVRWVQSSRMNHQLSAGYRDNFSDAQWMGNFAAAPDVPEIGGVSYVFGELDNQTIDLTLRSNLLFTRTQSLEVYVQPFISTGIYADPRALAAPDTRDLQPYGDPGFVLEQERKDINGGGRFMVASQELVETLNRIERGKTTPDFATVRKLVVAMTQRNQAHRSMMAGKEAGGG